MENCEQAYRQQNGTTRWNPTAEQLRILRELYSTIGIRSPTADQIQRIVWKLSRYGKIEGKNVFYWFQNHKARERQKKRLAAAQENLAYDMGDSSSSANQMIHTRYQYSEPTYEGKFFDSNTRIAEAKGNSSSMFVPVYKEQGNWEYYSKEASSLNTNNDYGNNVSEQDSIRHVETLELFPIRHENWSPKSDGQSVSTTVEERGRAREAGLHLCLNPHN
ncbi:hypothetical protein SUGI_1189870 [Cryptomeria japonica]|uniref:protein WUSCHEL n=1 Tax=Cryptomeria japonica TaxID=3369 RepID=UPI002414A360|nr:protein WUSCHEL [Cryptomeria japonica]GLJ55420.1 hypothetical protein SUGI_1189870 [Cryptomeria japonica]